MRDAQRISSLLIIYYSHKNDNYVIIRQSRYWYLSLHSLDIANSNDKYGMHILHTMLIVKYFHVGTHNI